jgi:hypothetical protein
MGKTCSGRPGRPWAMGNRSPRRWLWKPDAGTFPCPDPSDPGSFLADRLGFAPPRPPTVFQSAVRGADVRVLPSDHVVARRRGGSQRQRWPTAKGEGPRSGSRRGSGGCRRRTPCSWRRRRTGTPLYTASPANRLRGRGTTRSTDAAVTTVEPPRRRTESGPVARGRRRPCRWGKVQAAWPRQAFRE